MKAQYKKRGFEEVITPNLCSIDLWKTIGRYQNYKDNLFLLKTDNEVLGLKPMNCPCQCLMFKNKTQSYKELPVKIADFSDLHRNELSGVLYGLTRVRRFQ